MRPDRGIPGWSTSPRFALPGGPLLLLLLGVVLAAAGPAAAQWSTQAPLPTGLDVRGVGAPGASHVFLGTADDNFDNGGALWESTDGGATWTQRAVPFSLFDGLNGLSFRDALNGWAFGNDNYRTTDGGANWTQLPFLGSTYHMEFHTPVFGHATGNFGSQISFDGGLTWQAAPNNESDYDFVDASNGIAVADSGLFLTSDAGATFNPVFTGLADAAEYLTASVAVAIVDGAFARSTDGGATWTPGVTADGRTRLFAVDATTALAWGRSGTFPNYDDRIYRSTDEGQTWTDLGEPMAAGVWALTSPAPSVIVGADNSGGMHRSTDGGATWTQTFVSPGPFPGFLSSAEPAFADASNGYFGFGAGFVLRTTDGGATWTQVSSGSGNTLNAMARFANGDLIAVGDNGTVLTSAGGGTPWIWRPKFTTDNLTAVQTLNGTNVVVADESGFLHRSSDGGATWTTGAASSGVDGEGVDFTTLLDGWMIGFSPVAKSLYHTSDGGDSWTSVPDFQGAYVAVDFEGTNGWAQNVGGLFYRSTDDGATWTSGNLPGSPFQIQDLDFFDSSVGYAVGWNGYAARSADAGLTWQLLPTPNTTDDFTDIHLIGQNELWLATTNDVAYYTATGGQNWAVLPINSSGFGNFYSIVANSAGDAWTGGFQGYIEHFAGPPPPPLNRPPNASFTWVANGFDVDFTDTSSDPDGVIVSWLWDFGDSVTSTVQNPSHTYTVPGTYIVRLTVTDDDGDTGQYVQFIVAQPGPGGTFGDFTEVTPLDPLFVTPQNEDFWVASTAPGDYDNDGDLDVAVLGFYVVYFQSVVEQLVLLRNDGELGPGEWEFAYVDVPIGTLSTGASDMAWADVDNDGDQDLVVGSDGQTVVFRNDAGTLVMTDTVLPDYWEDNDQADFDLRSITWADYDNDGDQDLLLPSVFNDSTFTWETKLMRNDGPNGTGGFLFTEETAAGLDGTSHAQTAWADYDGDQDLDLFMVNLAPLTGQGFIKRYRNDGGGTFFAESILDTLKVEHGEAQWGDYDDDGDLDVLVAGHIQELDGSFNVVLRIYRNDAETYVPIEVIPSPAADGWFDLTAATWADYDSDGDVDILLCGTYNSGSQIEGRARVYDNDGAGNFTPSGSDLPAPRASGSRGGTFSWLDLDQDRDLDYFIAGEYFVPGGNGLVEAQMHAYRNDVIGTNAAPTAPATLAATVNGGTATLTWTAASDDKTPSTALTYDLLVREAGAPAPADPHRLPEPGNISHGTQWAVAGLADGNYTWTLRAVDSAYNGGSVASGSFSIGAPTDAGLNAGLPRDFALAAPFPNPFRGATTFRFALPAAANVKLSVFDVQGRLVQRLVDEPRTAGWHDVRWDARGSANGIYFVKLAAPGFSDTKRVLLLR